MSEYSEVDVPLCCLCSRFMMTYVGEVNIALNHEADEIYMVRSGKAYKCPQCGFVAVYKWRTKPMVMKPEDFKEEKFWHMFLEDHTHLNKGVGKK